MARFTLEKATRPSWAHDIEKGHDWMVVIDHELIATGERTKSQQIADRLKRRYGSKPPTRLDPS